MASLAEIRARLQEQEQKSGKTGGGDSASSALRSHCASTTGITMYNTTEVNKVSHGTLIADMPSSRPTSGANANTMIVSLSATCDKVNSGSPLVKRLHTNTMAVQGAAANKIRPAM